jgi:hypothetical protein
VWLLGPRSNLTGAYQHGNVQLSMVCSITSVPVARAPDFYIPIGRISMLTILMYLNLKKGKAAQWFCRGGLPHGMGCAPKLAKGTAMLGLDNT